MGKYFRAYSSVREGEKTVSNLQDLRHQCKLHFPNLRWVISRNDRWSRHVHASVQRVFQRENQAAEHGQDDSPLREQECEHRRWHDS